jgi:pyruvate/2-oxoglutarate dehydrogenase complex dihydrolipoamide dehydrogenase (E3) component
LAIRALLRSADDGLAFESALSRDRARIFAIAGGVGAVELIHIGQAVLALGGQIDYFIDTVFNYPTLAECYKNAAFDGINRLRLAPATLA